MSSYEVEHGVKEEQQTQPRRRPDLSTFFSQLENIDTTGARQPQNEHAIPLPQDVSAAYRTLANAFNMMRSDSAGPHVSAGRDPHSDLMTRLVEELMENAEHPPEQVEGVSDEFIEQLERVPKRNLKQDQDCPICARPFLDDTHPLVVRLPCHKDHLFDLECIQPWLKMKATCPLDRKELIKKKVPPAPKEEAEEDFDDMYA